MEIAGSTQSPPEYAQVSLINIRALRSLAGDPQAGAKTGDSMPEDLAQDEECLPLGSHLAMGSAVLRMSSLPHRPCAHFVDRLGCEGCQAGGALSACGPSRSLCSG
jgi:hypothetical protein